MARFAVISGAAPLVEAAGRAGRSRPKSRSLPQVHGFRPGITARSCCSFNFLAIRGNVMPGNPKECRKHAARCAELAMTARTEQLKARFLALSKHWEALAIQLEDVLATPAEREDIQLIVQETLDDSKQLLNLP